MSEQQHITHRQRDVPWWVPFCRWLWKHPIHFFVSTLFINVVINIGSSWLITSPTPSSSRDAPSPLVAMTGWVSAHWSFSLWLLTISGALLLVTWLASRWPEPTSLAPISAQDHTRLVKRLLTRYDQMLQQSLQGAIQIELGLVSRPTAIRNSALLALRLEEQADQVLPAHTSIVDVYERANQELLILGAPGAGKSTLLLELAHALVAQADQDATSPLPVLLPLSTWATKQPPLQDWLIEQFALLYDVPRTLSRQWIEAKLVLPLLDGLDEMDEAARPLCVVAINTYHREHFHPLVVCSRTSEYEQATLHERLALDAAVVVQPLSSAEVNAYLATLGKPLAALHTAFKKNPTLLELATTPLMLQILILTYAGTTIRQLSQKKAELEHQIWTAYVERMVARKGNIERYPFARTVSWLRWLAQQMRQQNQTIFFVELLQPDILTKPRRNLYRWSIVILVGLVVGLVVGLIVGLIVGLVVGLVVGLLYGLRFGQKSYIQPAERIAISWKRFLVGLVGGLLFGLVGGLFNGLLYGLVSGLVGGLFIGLVYGLFFGLESKQFSAHQALTPNEGIKRSFKNGLVVLLLAWLFGGLVGELFSRLVVGLVPGLVVGLVPGLFYGPFFGLVFGLSFGLLAVIQHYTLRFWLWRAHLFPWKAISFLEDATARILLQRVGGGYSFAHRLLMDYFANLNSDAPAPATKTQPGQQSPPW